MESSRRSPDLESGKRRRLGTDVEEVADEESDGPDRSVADATDGVDLDVDSRGLAGEKLGGDSEEESVVPGRVFASDPVDSGSELGGRVDPGECVRLHSLTGGSFEALGGDQVDLQHVRHLISVFFLHLGERSTVWI